MENLFNLLSAEALTLHLLGQQGHFVAVIQLQIAVDAVIVGAQAQNIAAANINNVLGMAFAR